MKRDTLLPVERAIWNSTERNAALQHHSVAVVCFLFCRYVNKCVFTKREYYTYQRDRVFRVITSGLSGSVTVTHCGHRLGGDFKCLRYWTTFQSCRINFLESWPF